MTGSWRWAGADERSIQCCGATPSTFISSNDSGGLFGQFTVPQSDRYDLTIAVKLEIFDDSGRVVASVNARAIRSHTVAADATLNDRERLWFDMTEATMKDLNGQLEKSIPLYLQAYLR